MKTQRRLRPRAAAACAAALALLCILGCTSARPLQDPAATNAAVAAATASATLATTVPANTTSGVAAANATSATAVAADTTTTNNNDINNNSSSGSSSTTAAANTTAVVPAAAPAAATGVSADTSSSSSSSTTTTATTAPTSTAVAADTAADTAANATSGSAADSTSRILTANAASEAPLRVLALGDSITMGSVPSKNYNHPYTLQLQKDLTQKLRPRTVFINNGGIGGAGIYATGFSNPINLVEATTRDLAAAKAQGIRYDYIIVMLGINDLLRMGRPASDVMEGLKTVYGMALSTGATVVAIPPFAAPGFVSKDDYKEGQRKQLANLISQYAADWNRSNPSRPPIVFANLQQQIDFYAMSDDQRRQWLDDGLHLTEQGYDRLGDRIANVLTSMVKVSRR